MELITTNQKFINFPITRILFGLIVYFISFIIPQHLATKISDFPIITGGQFGPEGIIQAIALFLASFILLQLCKNRIINPFWKVNPSI